MTQNNQQKSSGTLRGDQNRLMFGQGFSFSGYERDALFLNRDGKKFYEISGVSGIDSITDGRGAVFADLDNDGDYDVFLTTLQGMSHLVFRNNVGQDNHWLRISLEGGRETGIDAYGAVVRVKTSAGILTKVKAGGSGYLSSHDPRLLFGLGKDEAAQSVTVTWPNGKVEEFSGSLRAGNSLLLRYGSGRVEEQQVVATKLPDPLTKAQTLALGLKIKLSEPLPNVKVTTLAGKTVSLQSQLKPGRKTLVNLWATWCTSCAKEMPELEKVRASLAAAGVDLVGLNVDAEASPNGKVKGFLERTGATYPIVIGGQTALNQLFATDEVAVPLTIVVDEKGRVADLIGGWSGETKSKFLSLGKPEKPGQ